ncbi:hypothetical protein KAR91_02340 [Candidatus Pacearchaeota archaeon]|nr:hypothetical protein [Candidatus Pacearchaeota archaeon]
MSEKKEKLRIGNREFEVGENETAESLQNRIDNNIKIYQPSIPINPESAALTSHQRHARLVKMVRRNYQHDNPGAKLFPNTSGVAWQGNAVNGAGQVTLYNPRPVCFGIPEPEQKGTGQESGGADLLGETPVLHLTGRMIKMSPEYIHLPVLTAIEIKTGKSRLKPNQKHFKEWLLSINGIFKLARECPHCWNKWEPVRLKKKIFKWNVPACPTCGGVGYKLEG